MEHYTNENPRRWRGLMLAPFQGFIELDFALTTSNYPGLRTSH